MKKIEPKCLNGENPLGTTSRGYLIPCCYWDRIDLFNSEISDLVQEKFRLDNIISIESILSSEEWIDFYAKLKTGVGPKICQRYCSNGFYTKDFKII
jgi:hypothetical protein